MPNVKKKALYLGRDRRMMYYYPMVTHPHIVCGDSVLWKKSVVSDSLCVSCGNQSGSGQPFPSSIEGRCTLVRIFHMSSACRLSSCIGNVKVLLHQRQHHDQLMLYLYSDVNGQAWSTYDCIRNNHGMRYLEVCLLALLS